MMIKGFGLLIGASLVRLNPLVPKLIAAGFVKLALVGIMISQLSKLFVQVLVSVPSTAMASPAVLLVLAVIY
jgi:hypothetical protein